MVGGEGGDGNCQTSQGGAEKREDKKKENHRHEEARQKFTIAQETLQKVLEKRDSKLEQLLEKTSSTKV